MIKYKRQTWNQRKMITLRLINECVQKTENPTEQTYFTYIRLREHVHIVCVGQFKTHKPPNPARVP